MEASIRHQVAQLPHYDGNPASDAYFCNSVRNVLEIYEESASQAILNAFSYKLKGKAYENFINDASQHTLSRRRSNLSRNDISTAEAPITS